MCHRRSVANEMQFVCKAHTLGFDVKTFKRVRRYARYIYLAGRNAYRFADTPVGKYWQTIADHYSAVFRKDIYEAGYRMSYAGLMPVMVRKNGERVNPME